jgi:membrane protease YdiL (CAAX protease family)
VRFTLDSSVSGLAAILLVSFTFGAKWLAIITQAAAFGALHYSAPSIPSGVVGAGLTFLYGVGLGVLADQARGILGAWVAHFIADVLVFSFMIGWM